MSIESTKRVWASSKRSGSSLLMLLAIADYANDDTGMAYPSVKSLAEMCRMTSRHANRLLAELRDSGELQIRLGQGKKGANLYVLGFDRMTRKSPLTDTSPLTYASPPDASVDLTPASPPPDAGVLNPLTPASVEPSMNHQEPSPARSRPRMAPTKSASKPSKRRLNGHDAIPALDADVEKQIIAAWNRMVETIDDSPLPPIACSKLDTSKNRRKLVEAGWEWIFTTRKANGQRRATSADEGIVWITRLLERAAADPWIRGTGHRSPSHEKWRAGIEHVLKPERLERLTTEPS